MLLRKNTVKTGNTWPPLEGRRVSWYQRRWERMLESLVRGVALVSGISVLLVVLFLLWEASSMIGVPSIVSSEQQRAVPLEIDNTRHKSENNPRRSEVLWSPAGAPPLHTLWPLLLEGLKVTVIAISVATPLALATALSVAHLGFRRHRRWAKPVLEMLASVPSVIVGAFALIVIAPWVEKMTGLPFRLNATVAGLALGLAIVPILFSLAEDAMSAVSVDLIRAALGLGATPWQVACKVVLPVTAPSLLASVLISSTRALGETMLVLMLCGNISMIRWNPLTPVRTLTSTLAGEMGESTLSGPHYPMLFVIGLILFVVTSALTGLAHWLVRRTQRHLREGS
ncbi:MAG: ABC transporter permease subunit [Pedosphaera sp.]|nr:ABC transporter permease subunit [Pedosphaera sp.]